MTTTAVFMFAGLLLLVAITGGGFEVKELKVPKVGRKSRLAAFASSVIVLLLGLHLDRAPAAAGPATADRKAPQGVEAPASPSTPAQAQPQIILLARTPEELGMTGAGAGPAARPGQPQAAAPAPELRSGPEAKSGPAASTGGSSKTEKKVPWEQKPRRWLQRFKATAG